MNDKPYVSHEFSFLIFSFIQIVLCCFLISFNVPKINFTHSLASYFRTLYMLVYNNVYMLNLIFSSATSLSSVAISYIIRTGPDAGGCQQGHMAEATIFRLSVYNFKKNQF